MKEWLFFLSALALGATAETIPAADPRLEYSDYDVIEKSDEYVGFARRMAIPSRYHLDSPGARLRFRCDAAALEVRLIYGERETLPRRAQNDVGVFLIDGEGRAEWSFQRPQPGRDAREVTVKLPADGRMHTYELVMPYGDIVRVRQVEVNAGVTFEKPEPRHALRCVFFGDSVTHGFSAGRIDRTWPYLISQAKGYECVNFGLAGIGIQPEAGARLAELNLDQLIVAIGVNDWQGGREPERVEADLDALLANFRKGRPETPVTVISPLWVAPSWRPEAVRYELRLYREAIARAARKHDCQVIAGDELTDHDPALFDTGAAVHPNDRGFAQIAERLAAWL